VNATEKLMWRSECRPGETGRDAAVRFVADVQRCPKCRAVKPERDYGPSPFGRELR